MTAKELIDHLKMMDPDSIIYSEGCDCSEKAKGVREFKNFEGETCVQITR